LVHKIEKTDTSELIQYARYPKYHNGPLRLRIKHIQERLFEYQTYVDQGALYKLNEYLLLS